LAPRQRITPTPYAITAQTANNLVGAVSSNQLAGVYPGAVTLDNAGNSFAGNGAGLVDVNAITLGGFGPGSFWQLHGNAGRSGENFLGTTDNQALEFKVNGQRAVRIEPSSTTPNLIGGYFGNSVSGAVGATIGGGGGADEANQIMEDFATIGGGSANW